MRFAAILAVVVLAAGLAGASPKIAASKSLGNQSAVEWEPAKEVVVKWTQLPEAGGVGVTSEQSIALGIVSESGDDFLCDDGSPIVAVEWWGVDYTGGLIDYFIVRFYTDDGGLPGTLAYEEECHAFDSELMAGQFDRYRYYAALPSAFDQDGGVTYWFSVQAVHPDDQWFWLESANAEGWNLGGVVRSEYFGCPDWVTVSEATGTRREFSFVLYADVTSPVESTTWGGVKALFR
jgi:hypothetical protein